MKTKKEIRDFARGFTRADMIDLFEEFTTVCANHSDDKEEEDLYERMKCAIDNVWDDLEKTEDVLDKWKSGEIRFEE